MSAGPVPRPRVATVTLAGCFGCHMSLLDLDEALLELAARIEIVRSPLVDLRDWSDCDIALVEGGLCNQENVEVLREVRRRARVLVALGACAVNGGLPAQRNHLDVRECLQTVYVERPGERLGRVPDDPELPLPLDQVYPLHAVVRVDHFVPGCPPSAAVIGATLEALLQGRAPRLPAGSLRYD
jgi:NAD-reducing hydrogenase small subunit